MMQLFLTILLILGSSCVGSLAHAQGSVAECTLEQQLHTKQQVSRFVVVDRRGLRIAGLIQQIFTPGAAPSSQSKHSLRPSLWTNPRLGAFGAQASFSF